jgi:hypothetical protein
MSLAEVKILTVQDLRDALSVVLRRREVDHLVVSADVALVGVAQGLRLDVPLGLLRATEGLAVRTPLGELVGELVPGGGGVNDAADAHGAGHHGVGVGGVGADAGGLAGAAVDSPSVGAAPEEVAPVALGAGDVGAVADEAGALDAHGLHVRQDVLGSQRPTVAV